MNVTLKMKDSEKMVEKLLVKGILGTKAEEGLLSTEAVDPVIRGLGDQVITAAKARLGGAGMTKEVAEMIGRIGWAKKPIITVKGHTEQFRFGTVVSNHPASVRHEFGTAGTAKRAGYTATFFMRRAALMTAARKRGVRFKPETREGIVESVSA